MAGDAGKNISRKPIPKGVVEIKGITADGGIVELKDGSLFLAQGGGINDSAKVPGNCRISKDGGETWSDPRPLSAEIGIGGLIRLQSGALAAYGRKIAPGADCLEMPTFVDACLGDHNAAIKSQAAGPAS